jgi:hypothetical protein
MCRFFVTMSWVFDISDTIGVFVRLFYRDFVHEWREGETFGDENFIRLLRPSPGERRNARKREYH